MYRYKKTTVTEYELKWSISLFGVIVSVKDISCWGVSWFTYSKYGSTVDISGATDAKPLHNTRKIWYLLKTIFQ